MDDSCRLFDALIARSGQLTAEQAAALQAHLGSCDACRELALAVKPLSNDAAFAVTGTAETMMSDSGQANVATGSQEVHLPEATGDRYRVTGEVGRGGIGRVLRALDTVLDRPVALKELFLTNDGTRRRFIREALITARLQHPSIVPIYDAGHFGDRSPFYAMKLVAGRPLDRSIAEATTLAQRLALLPSVLAVADAMACAHNERIIHRDLKPSNVLVGKYGETIVIDWGLAKDLAIDDRDALDAGAYRAAGLDRTVGGVVMGTPAYMAPEQATGEPVDERADVYALGAILYHVVSGAIAHEGNTLEEMVQRVVSGGVRPLAEREPDVPRDLAAIVTKAMAVNPAERYPNAQGLAEDLRRFLNGQLVASHTYGTPELLRRWVKRHRAAVTVALAALVVVCFVGIESITRIVRAREAADEAAAVATKERAIAEGEKNTATERLAAALVEQGRQELLEGNPARAAVYLSQAQTQTRDPGVGLRALLADAMRSLEAERLSLEGHSKDVRSGAFSPDGRLIVTGGGDSLVKVWDVSTGTVVTTVQGDSAPVSFSPDSARIVTVSWQTAQLWDARTGKRLATFDHPDSVRAVAFSPNGAMVVTTGKGGTARLWDANTAQLLRSLDGHRGDVYSAAFSPDGARVVTASKDRTAKVWNAKTGKLILTLKGHGHAVNSAVFSPDGSQIVTASEDHTARLWDARTGKLLASLEGHGDYVASAAYSADGTRVVTASDDYTAKLWDARTGKLLVTFRGHTGDIHSAVFSPDGSRVVTASEDHTAKLWDVQTGAPLASFESHRDAVAAASFSPDGTQIVTASADGTAKVWDAKPNQLRVSIDAGAGPIKSVKLTPDGARLATSVEHDHVVKLWDVRSGKLLASLDGHHGEISSMNFDAAGIRIVTVNVDHTAELWDSTTGKQLVAFDHADDVTTARLSPDGMRVVTTGVDNGGRIWNAETGELIARLDGTELPHRLPAPDHLYSAMFSKDGGRVVTTSEDGTGRIWRADSGKLVAQLDGHTDDVLWAVFSDDGERVVTVSGDQTAIVWDARTGKLLASLEGHTAHVHRAWFSRDGARVVTVSDDHTAKLWDARTGKLLVSFDGHLDELLYATFSPDPDGARVLTASSDRTVKLWDARTGKLLTSLHHTAPILDAVFSPDGAHLITTSRDGTIWIWDVHLEDRKPDAIGPIISARDPWTLSNDGLVLVPVPDAWRATPDQGSAAPPPRSEPGALALTSNDQAVAMIAALYGQLRDLFKEPGLLRDLFKVPDCDRLAASMSSFVDSNRAKFNALAAWVSTHKVDRSALAKAIAPTMTDYRSWGPTIAKCRQNGAFMAAMATAAANLPR
jgi:WD40 repeat protein